LRTERREEEELWTEWCGECTGVAESTARIRGERESVAMFAGLSPTPPFVAARCFKRMSLHLGSRWLYQVPPAVTSDVLFRSSRRLLRERLCRTGTSRLRGHARCRWLATVESGEVSLAFWFSILSMVWCSTHRTPDMFLTHHSARWRVYPIYLLLVARTLSVLSREPW
jgi:hypothetical protein